MLVQPTHARVSHKARLGGIAAGLLLHKFHTPHQHCPGGATIPPCPRPPSATYQRLRETIANQMRMSHVYQRLMLMELLGRRSPAPAQDVARRMGITRCERGTYALVGGVAQGFCAALELLSAETVWGDRGTSRISTSQPSTSA
jgi:hypothetical protein